MPFTRRSVLIGAAGLTTLGTVVSEAGPALFGTIPASRGIGVAIGVDDAQEFRGLSQTVTLEHVRDPWEGPGNQGESENAGGGQNDERGDDQGNGTDRGRGNEDVLHVTSLGSDTPGNAPETDEEAEANPTFDIALSLIDVSDRELLVSDIADYDGEQPGFVYDWSATEADVVGVGTDHEGVGSPDDVWFFLDSDPDSVGGPTGESWPQFADATAVFRTMYADRNDDAGGFAEDWGYEEWNTRDVTAEFDAPGWKALDLDGRRFVRLDEGFVDAYGDASVIGVGISRGDPYYGPSVLDSYYRDLSLAGERYELPTTVDLGNGPGQGRNGSNGPDT